MKQKLLFALPLLACVKPVNSDDYDPYFDSEDPEVLAIEREDSQDLEQPEKRSNSEEDSEESIQGSYKDNLNWERAMVVATLGGAICGAMTLATIEHRFGFGVTNCPRIALGSCALASSVVGTAFIGRFFPEIAETLVDMVRSFI